MRKKLREKTNSLCSFRRRPYFQAAYIGLLSRYAGLAPGRGTSAHFAGYSCKSRSRPSRSENGPPIRQHKSDEYSKSDCQ